MYENKVLLKLELNNSRGSLVRWFYKQIFCRYLPFIFLFTAGHTRVFLIFKLYNVANAFAFFINIHDLVDKICSLRCLTLVEGMVSE